MTIDRHIIARLHAEYLAGLPARLETLLALRARVLAGDPLAPPGARMVGHQFAGMGGSFGFPLLSERGQALELAASEQLVEALDRLAEAVQAVIGPPLP